MLHMPIVLGLNFLQANEVVVYAKLPRTFQIPTPVGNYATDWAIAMKKNDVKHIFFIAKAKAAFAEKYGHEPAVIPVVISDGARKLA